MKHQTNKMFISWLSSVLWFFPFWRKCLYCWEVRHYFQFTDALQKRHETKTDADLKTLYKAQLKTWDTQQQDPSGEMISPAFLIMIWSVVCQWYSQCIVALLCLLCIIVSLQRTHSLSSIICSDSEGVIGASYTLSSDIIDVRYVECAVKILCPSNFFILTTSTK